MTHLIQWRWRLLALGLSFVAILLFGYLLLRPDGLTHIYILDVGQGDSILIRTPSQQSILIDGGPDSSVLNELGQSLPLWDRTIDLIVLTHPDADHVSGLVSVLENYQIGTIWAHSIEHDTLIYRQFQEVAAAKNIPVVPVRESAAATFGPATLTILYPFESTRLEDRASNDTSIVTRLTVQDFDLLLAGDIGMGVETELVSAGVLDDIEVLKVAHHGSKNSSGAAFLAVTTPELATIGVGAGNRHGHPAPEALNRLAAAGVRLLRTDENGRIQISTDGQRYYVKTRR